eukprot:1964040-Prymnesium_polylepis.1
MLPGKHPRNVPRNVPISVDISRAGSRRSLCPRRSPGPFGILHAEPGVVSQGDVESSEGLWVGVLRL